MAHLLCFLGKAVRAALVCKAYHILEMLEVMSLLDSAGVQAEL